MSKSCVKCGNILQNDDMFCDECGAIQKQESVPKIIPSIPKININSAELQKSGINMPDISKSAIKGKFKMKDGDPVKKAETMAGVSLAFGIISIFVLGLLVVPQALGLIFGIKSLNEPAQQKRKYSVFGIILSSLAVLSVTIMVIVTGGADSEPIESNIAETESDMVISETIADISDETAIEAADEITEITSEIVTAETEKSTEHELYPAYVRLLDDIIRDELFPLQAGYALIDLDNDGIDEFVVGDGEGLIYGIYTCYSGEYVSVAVYWGGAHMDPSYLCEGNIIELFWYERMAPDNGYNFMKFNGRTGEFDFVEEVYYQDEPDPITGEYGENTGTWYHRKGNDEAVIITAEQKDEIVNSYIVTPFDVILFEDYASGNVFSNDIDLPETETTAEIIENSTKITEDEAINIVKNWFDEKLYGFVCDFSLHNDSTDIYGNECYSVYVVQGEPLATAYVNKITGEMTIDDKTADDWYASEWLPLYNEMVPSDVKSAQRIAEEYLMRFPVITIIDYDYYLELSSSKNLDKTPKIWYNKRKPMRW